MQTISREPVLTAQSITALISAGMVMLVALNVIDLDDTQQAAIMAFAIAAVNIIAGVIARSWVTPLASPRAADGTPLVKSTEYPQ